MSRPIGSKNKPRAARTDDAYGEAFLSSVGNRNLSYGRMGAAWLMDRTISESLYLSNGFARLLVDRVAEEMTRAGFDLDNLPEPIEETVTARIEELDAMNKFCDAIRWSRAFGGAAIVLGIKDGGNFETPLKENAIQAVEFMRVYDRFELSEVSRYNDPKLETFGRVEKWKISPNYGGQPYDVHESRIFIFDGDTIPNALRNMNQGWGASILQKCFTELQRLNSGHKWAELLLQRSQQAVHGIPNLSDQLETPEGAALVVKRIDIVDTVRNAQNTVVIDSLETYDVKNASISGVSELLDRFAEALSSVSGIPVFVLMGRSAGGLNSPGESNEKSWFALIENKQNNELRKPLDRLISYLILESNGGKSDGADYSLKFKPLSSLSEVEEAELDNKKALTAKTKADTHNIYIDKGVLDPIEVRNELKVDNEFIDDSIEPISTAEKLQEQANEFAQSEAAKLGNKPNGGKNAKSK